MRVPAPFILASASPRRRELLAAAGFTFEVEAADVDETRHPDEPASAYALRLALAKARAVADRRPHAMVLGADTVVVLDEEVLGKPVDDEDAVRMLTALAGRQHRVLTAVAIVGPELAVNTVEETVVWMDALDPRAILAYVASGEPRDKAGAYGIQGLASRFIPKIEGSYTNVVGLPVASVDALLRKATVIS